MIVIIVSLKKPLVPSAWELNCNLELASNLDTEGLMFFYSCFLVLLVFFMAWYPVTIPPLNAVKVDPGILLIGVCVFLLFFEMFGCIIFSCTNKTILDH